jgi:hypothetical protein
MNAKQRRREKFLRGEQKSHLPSFIRRREKPNIFGIAAAAPVFFPLQINFFLSPKTTRVTCKHGAAKKGYRKRGSVEQLGLGAGNHVEKRGEKDNFFL